MQGGYTKESLQKIQDYFRGTYIFSCELGFFVYTNTDNFYKCAKSYFLSTRYFHISYLLAAAISLFSCSLPIPPPLPTEGFTASFVQTSHRFRTCQNQEGAAYNKKETELPLILNSKCVLSINFRPFANPPLGSLLGKSDFSSGELTFRHFSNILRIVQSLIEIHFSPEFYFSL